VDTIKPKRLEQGQTIGIVAPASPANEDEQIEFAIDIVKSLGFRVKEGTYLYGRHNYLAGTDQDRAADINQMFADDEVDAIITLRGGYGSTRLLPYLDYELIRRQPKVITGYSDITALLNAIYQKTGLITFHGPEAERSFTPYTLAEFKKVLMLPEAKLVIGSPPKFEVSEGNVERENRLAKIVPGRVQGQLIGGNLTLVVDLLGTPFEPDFKEKILFVEEIGETTDEIDRRLTHLWLAGKLQQLAGIVFGKFVDCGYLSAWAKRFTLSEVLSERCKALGLPTLGGLMIGHVDDQTTVPIGGKAELDVEAGTLTLIEEVVL
jgi:muramoyltetrapeptide carboxypeptidase